MNFSFIFSFATTSRSGKSVTGAFVVSEIDEGHAVTKGLGIVRKNNPGCGDITHSIRLNRREIETQFPYDGTLF